MTATVRRTRFDQAPVRAAALATTLALVLALPAAAAAAPARKARPSALPAFGSCKSLLGYAHRNARRTGGGTGVPTRAGAVMPQVLSTPAPMVLMDSTGAAPVPAAAAPPASAESKAAPSFSSTNV